MDKMKMSTPDFTRINVEKIAEMFPNVVTEAKDEQGNLIHKIDFEKLKQELSPDVIDGDESYDFTWVGKKSAMVEANKPTNKTLRPCLDESVNWEKTENLYIEGDNLQILKCLQESYIKKIDIIYIDPPYNTGNNLIYKNDFYQRECEYEEESGNIDDDGNRLVLNSKSNGRFHSDWCSMIYSRLRLAKSLLSDVGMIVLTIDDNEIKNVTSIMNEIFGEENHLATIIIKNNPSGRSTLSGVSISHEYALFYGDNPNVKLGRLQRNDKQIARYKESDEFGQFEWVNFRKHGGYKEDAPSMYYPIYIKLDCSSFRIPKLKWDDNIKEYVIMEKPVSDEIISYPIDENGRKRRWKWGLDRALNSNAEMSIRLDRDKKPAVYIKSRMKDEGMLPLTVWDEKKYSSTEYGTNMLIELLGNKFFDYPKSLYAVIDSIKVAGGNNHSTILDFFSGSATTAHAVMQLNAEDGGKRKFIMVQLPEVCDEKSEAYKAGYKNICEIGKERIRRAGKKIIEETGKTDLDIGFRVLKLDESNMKDVYYMPDELSQSDLIDSISNIKEGRSGYDLLYQCMLDWGLELSLPHRMERINNNEVHIVNDGDLIACFDDKIPEETVKQIADLKPLRVVFRDSSFATPAARINVDEIFKLKSPQTTIKVL